MKIFYELIILCLTLSSRALSLSSSSTKRRLNKPNPKRSIDSSAQNYEHNPTRRQWMQHQFFFMGGWCIWNTAAEAACLPGDLSVECIGVYKVPMDENILPYVGTPEALKKFAPDLKYVPPIRPPSSFSAALEMLETQRIAADDIQQVVLAGRLEEAGIKVLNFMPKVTSSGKLIVDIIEQGLDPNKSPMDEIKLTRIQDQLNMVIALWGECDVTIGQGLRGQMGVSAVAQLQILSSLREATAALDDFMASINTLFKDKKL
jgi:hypothetical protein